MQLLRTVAVLITVVLTSKTGVAQESKELVFMPAQTQTSRVISETVLGRILNFMKGTAPKDGLLIMPVGWHSSDPLTANNLTPNNLFAISKKSVIGGTFENSYDDRVWFLGITRTVYVHERFGLDYSTGLMVGYKGKLSYLFNGLLQPAFSGNINPYFSVSPYYLLSDKLEARVLLAPPNVVVFGLKYRF